VFCLTNTTTKSSKHNIKLILYNSKYLLCCGAKNVFILCLSRRSRKGHVYLKNFLKDILMLLHSTNHPNTLLVNSKKIVYIVWSY